MEVDAEKLVAFCNERIEQMRNPLTKAIYAGLRDRILRGYFSKGYDGD